MSLASLSKFRGYPRNVATHSRVHLSVDTLTLVLQFVAFFELPVFELVCRQWSSVCSTSFNRGGESEWWEVLIALLEKSDSNMDIPLSSVASAFFAGCGGISFETSNFDMSTYRLSRSLDSYLKNVNNLTLFSRARDWYQDVLPDYSSASTLVYNASEKFRLEKQILCIGKLCLECEVNSETVSRLLDRTLITECNSKDSCLLLYCGLKNRVLVRTRVLEALSEFDVNNTTFQVKRHEGCSSSHDGVFGGLTGVSTFSSTEWTTVYTLRKLCRYIGLPGLTACLLNKYLLLSVTNDQAPLFPIEVCLQ